MVRKLVASEDYLILNNTKLAKGGPFTRIDPADQEKKSCLDLVIISLNLLPFVKELLVDKEKKFTPMRVITKGNGLGVRHTDHLSLKIKLGGLPTSQYEVQSQTKWNLMKPGGWEKYKEATEDIAEKIVEIIDNEHDIDEVIKKVEKLQDKAKFVSFNKTKISKEKQIRVLKDQNSVEAKELLQKQSDKLEKEIIEIKNSKLGRASQVFKMKARIGGSKKLGQEANAIKDPKSGELLVASENIKQATLEYNCGVLRNNEAEEGFEELVRLKESLHDIRMKDKIGSGSFSINRLCKSNQKV